MLSCCRIVAVKKLKLSRAQLGYQKCFRKLQLLGIALAKAEKYSNVNLNCLKIENIIAISLKRFQCPPLQKI